MAGLNASVFAAVGRDLRTKTTGGGAHRTYTLKLTPSIGVACHDF